MKRLGAWFRMQRVSDWTYYFVMTFYLLFFVWLLIGCWM